MSQLLGITDTRNLEKISPTIVDLGILQTNAFTIKPYEEEDKDEYSLYLDYNILYKVVIGDGASISIVDFSRPESLTIISYNALDGLGYGYSSTTQSYGTYTITSSSNPSNQRSHLTIIFVLFDTAPYWRSPTGGGN